jgi:hypothetical protein
VHPHTLVNSPRNEKPECVLPLKRANCCTVATLMLGDGSVRFVSSSINTGIWQALGSRNGQEVIGDF